MVIPAVLVPAHRSTCFIPARRKSKECEISPSSKMEGSPKCQRQDKMSAAVTVVMPTRWGYGLHTLDAVNQLSKPKNRTNNYDLGYSAGCGTALENGG